MFAYFHVQSWGILKNEIQLFNLNSKQLLDDSNFVEYPIYIFLRAR